MQNKNKKEKPENISSEEISAKIDPANEISGAQEEKLIAESNKDGVEENLTPETENNIDDNRDTTEPVKSEELSQEEAPAAQMDDGYGADKTDNPYGSFVKSMNEGISRKNKKMPIILVVVTLFIVAALASAAYIFVFNKPVTKESPQDIIKSSMTAMRGLKTYGNHGNFSAQINLNDKNVGNVAYEVKADITGRTDMSDLENIKGDANLKLSVEMKSDSGSDDYSVDFDGRAFGTKQAYYRINNFDLGIFGMVIAPQLSSYKGKWYLFDTDEMKKISGSDNQSGLIYENYNINNLSEILNRYEMFKFSEDLGVEKIGDVEVYHYKTKIDGMAVAYTYLDMVKEMISSGKGVDVEKMEQSLSEVKSEIEKNYKDLINEGFQNIESEVWIGKNDRMIYRMTMKGNFSEQYLNKVANVMFAPARAKAQDARIRSQMVSVRTSLEIYYDDNNGSYENFKLSSDADSKSIKVNASKDEYVIWSDLSSSEDKWCQDSSGKSGYVLGKIDGYKCPDSMTDVAKGAKKDLSQNKDNSADLKTNANFNMDFYYTDFNKPVTVEKPSDAVNFFEEMNKNGSVKGADSDNDGLNDYMESYYNTDPNNPDTDGDSYKDGVEVKNGYDPTKPGSAKLEYK